MLPGYTDEALALRLAMTVNDKSDVELEELARANPHLHQEWLEELGATRQCARAQAELCETHDRQRRVGGARSRARTVMHLGIVELCEVWSGS